MSKALLMNVLNFMNIIYIYTFFYMNIELIYDKLLYNVIF